MSEHEATLRAREEIGMGAPREHEAPDLPFALMEFDDVLEQIALALGMDVTDSQLASALSNALEHMARQDWSARLIGSCEALGLASTSVQLTPLQASQASVLGRGVLVTHIDESFGWMILSHSTKKRTRALHVSPDGSVHMTALTRYELSTVLGVGLREEIGWVVIESLLPMQPISLRGKGPTPDAPEDRAIDRIKRYILMERAAVTAVFVYAILVGLLSLLTPIAVQGLVNTIAFNVLLQPVIVLAGVVFIGLLFVGALRVTEHYVVEYIQRRLFVRLTVDLSHRLPRVDTCVHEHYYMPELINRFFDVLTVQKAVATLLLDSLELLLGMTIGMLVLAFYHPYLLAFDVVLVLAVGVVVFVMGRGAVHTSIEESDAKYEAVAWLQEIGRHPLSFKSLRGERVASFRAERLAMKWLGARSRHWRILMRQLVGAAGVQAFASAGLLGLGGWLVIQEQLSLGQLVAAELIVTTVAASISKLGKHMEKYYDLAAGIHKIGKLLDLPLEPQSGEMLQSSPRPLGVDLQDVAVQRGSAKLNDVTLSVQPGERVAIVGADGAGKSALCDVIYGLRRPDRGTIRVDGLDQRELALGAMRDQISFVREWDVFDGSIDENVRLGMREHSPSHVREALARVHLLDELERLPNGLQTHLLPDGDPLSPDQLDRLMLARAILEQPRLLMIDGTLDGVRPERLDPVLDALCGPQSPWTLIIVTHNSQVLARCQRVLELTNEGLREHASTTDADGQT